HTLAFAGPVMTGRAVDVEALLASAEVALGDWKRECRDGLVSGFAGVELFIVVQMASRDSPGEQRSGGAAIFEEGAAAKGLVARLVAHVLSAGCGGEQEKTGQEACPTVGQASRPAQNFVSTLFPNPQPGSPPAAPALPGTGP